MSSRKHAAVLVCSVLALTQTLGSPTTAAILPDLRSSQVVAVPASWTSLWGFEEVVLESGADYCVESMNAVDYAVDELGAKVAAEGRGLPFSAAVTQTGQDNQGGAIDAVVSADPDVVILTTGPTDAAAIIGQAAESPGHAAMREALRGVTPNDGYTSGWVWAYPLKAALEKAAENKDLTRAGVLNAVRQLDSVDYEGMLPEGAGKFTGTPDESTFRQSLIYRPDAGAVAGVSLVEDFFTGPTAKAFEFEKPCYQ